VYAGIVTRAELDSAFVDHARARGVQVRDADGLASLDRVGDAWVATLDSGDEFDVSWIVAADGHWSRVRRITQGGDRPDPGSWHAERWYVDGYHDPRIHVAFIPELLPGYLWVFPLPGGRANVGWGVKRAGRSGRDLDRLSRLVADHAVLKEVLGGAGATSPRRAWPIPTAFSPAKLTGDRVLYVGDAAAVVDPMTGEGIAQALDTGVAAIGAIARGGEVTTAYRRSVTRSLGRDLRFAAVLGRILQSTSGARGAVRIAGLTPWTRRNFARWLFEDYPRALALTPDRWGRRMRPRQGVQR
jgi:flavin-dependent dehydrogenase